MEPFERGGAWWQQQPDGTWLRWNDHAQRWEPQTSPPPPPEPGEVVPAPPAYQSGQVQPGQYPPGQYPPATGYGQGYPQQAAGPKTNGMAIGSLICGIVGLLLCGILLGPVAIGLGFAARKRIAESGGYEQGQGMATAGIIMGFVGVAIFVLFLLAGFGDIWFSLSSP